MRKTKLPEKYSKEDMKKLLETRDDAVVRAIVVLYTYQTTEEQKCKQTMLYNNVGFNGADSKILSSFAEQINKGYKLSPKQMNLAKRKIMKYAGQLAKIANEKWRKEEGLVA